MIQLCPSCEGKLSNRGSYCPTCGIQARCKTCGVVLELEARFCVNCGTALGEGVSPDSSNTGEGSTESVYNVIEFEEDAKRRSFRARVTDRAVDSVSKPLTFFLARNTGALTKRSQRLPVSSTLNAEELQPDSPEMVLDASRETREKDPAMDGAETRQVLTNDSLEQLKTIFRSTGGNKLKLINSRLKQKSRADFVKRLSVLFLLMNDLTGKDTVPRSDLNAVLSDSKVYNSTSRTWIARTDLLARDDNSISLSVPGRYLAERVLEEIRDRQIETEWLLDSSGARPNRSNQKRNTLSKTSSPRADETKPLVWTHDPNRWGTPSQNWTTAEKAQWLLHVVSQQTDIREIPSSQIAATFNKHFREAGPIRPQNVARDLGKLKTESPAPVSQDTMKDSKPWFLTQSGKTKAAELVSQGLGRSSDTEEGS